ncbi:SPW repeat domain-containing protein [Actinokineospora sp. 24-640]
MSTTDNDPRQDAAWETLDDRTPTAPGASASAPTVSRTRSPNRFGATLPSALALLAGVWVVIAPFALGYADAGAFAFWNDVLVGAAIALVALPRVLRTRRAPWLSVVNVVLGAWLVLAPFLVGYRETTPAAVGNDVIMGIMVVILAGTSALLTFLVRAHDEEPTAGSR